LPLSGFALGFKKKKMLSQRRAKKKLIDFIHGIVYYGIVFLIARYKK